MHLALKRPCVSRPHRSIHNTARRPQSQRKEINDILGSLSASLARFELGFRERKLHLPRPWDALLYQHVGHICLVKCQIQIHSYQFGGRVNASQATGHAEPIIGRSSLTGPCRDPPFSFASHSVLGSLGNFLGSSNSKLLFMHSCPFLR